MSDIVFLRAWIGVDLPRFYNPVTNLLGPAAKQAPRQLKPGHLPPEVRLLCTACFLCNLCEFRCAACADASASLALPCVSRSVAKTSIEKHIHMVKLCQVQLPSRHMATGNSMTYSANGTMTVSGSEDLCQICLSMLLGLVNHVHASAEKHPSISPDSSGNSSPCLWPEPRHITTPGCLFSLVCFLRFLQNVCSPAGPQCHCFGGNRCKCHGTGCPQAHPRGCSPGHHRGGPSSPFQTIRQLLRCACPSMRFLT